MRKVLTFFAAVLLTASGFGQVPEKISYQAVIRNSSDELITNQQVGMRISILQGSANGTTVYTETQIPTTNTNGLVSIEIGGEVGFEDIDWADGTYFIKTETDPAGGSDYTITGTSQLLSVPYALHAKTAEAATGALLARIEALEDMALADGFTDLRDGNHYNVVRIGDQVWMAENLKYLPSVVGPDTGSGTDPYYYVYEYNGTDLNAAKATDNYATYGVLYNWAAAMADAESSDDNPSGVQGVCPTGWHLPSDAEWTELTDYLDGEAVAGGKLKETGTEHWNAPNTGATNETGFTALPGGFRAHNGTFQNIGNNGCWQSATEGDDLYIWYRYIRYNASSVDRYYNTKTSGFSVRCIKD